MSYKQSICNTCPAWKKSLFSSLNEHELFELSKIKAICRYQKNEHLFKQGAEVTGLYCNGEGLVKVDQSDSSGKVKFSRLVYPGDTAGHRSIFIEKNYKGTASAVSESVNCCYISKDNVLQFFAKNNEFAKKLITKLSFELEGSEKDQIESKEKSVFSRVCSLLIKLFDNFSETNLQGTQQLTISISKADIAKILSVADETIIRAMSELKNDSVIDFSGKIILLLNKEKLKSYSLP